MIVVIARAKIRPEKRDGFLAAAAVCVETSRAESGNLAYDVYESATETNAFVPGFPADHGAKRGRNAPDRGDHPRKDRHARLRTTP